MNASWPRPPPAVTSALVGRADQIDELRPLLDEAGGVTLVGSPGVGKTRFALELARLADQTRDAYWVDLTSLPNGDLVADAVAATAGLPDDGNRRAIQLVIDHLHRSNALVVLDNCERLIDGVREFIDSVTASCPGITVLATSRQALGASAERVSTLSPLNPAAAEELFYERANAHQIGFAVDDEAAAAVAEICERLEGIPLAIELAAARIGMLPPTEIAARLRDDILVLLGNGNGLRTSIDRSVSLLSPAEATLLRQLSIFAGGWSQDAAAAVCDGADQLTSLAAKSLIISDGERHRFLETLRAYAAESLDVAGETADLAARHAAWCVAFAEEIEPELTGSNQLEAFARIDADIDNLRAGWTWSIDNRPIDALRVAGSLTVWWRIRGRFSEGRRLLEPSLERCTGAPDELRAKALWGAGFMAHMLRDDNVAVGELVEALRLSRDMDDLCGEARALLLVGNVKMGSSANDAFRDLERCASLSREANDTWCESHALALLGRIHRDRGRHDQATKALEEGLDAARVANDVQGLRINLTLLGICAFDRGDVTSAQAHMTEALALVRRLGDAYGIAAVSNYLAEVAMWKTQYGEAHEALEEALEVQGSVVLTDDPTFTQRGLGMLSLLRDDSILAREHFSEAFRVSCNDGNPSCGALWGLGAVEAYQGNLTAAGERCDELLGLAGKIRDREVAAYATFGLGLLARAEGQNERALALLRRSLTLFQDLGISRELSYLLEEFAVTASAAGSPAQAARLLAASQTAEKESRGPRDPSRNQRLDACLTALRREMGSRRLERAWAEGTRMSLVDAVCSAIRGHGRASRPSHGWPSLTGTEQEIVRLVIQGCSNREISGRFFVSPKTVRNHLTHVFAKLGVDSRADLVSDAASLGEIAVATEDR